MQKEEAWRRWSFCLEKRFSVPSLTHSLPKPTCRGNQTRKAEKMVSEHGTEEEWRKSLQGCFVWTRRKLRKSTLELGTPPPSCPGRSLTVSGANQQVWPGAAGLDKKLAEASCLWYGSLTLEFRCAYAIWSVSHVFKNDSWFIFGWGAPVPVLLDTRMC